MTRSPIMGNSANGGNAGKRGIWWLTNMESGQQSPDPIQDDLAVISSANNGFGYGADDWSYNNYFTMPVAADGCWARQRPHREHRRRRSLPISGDRHHRHFQDHVGAHRRRRGMLEPSGRLVDATTLQPIPYNIVANGTTATLSTSSLVAGHDYYIERQFRKLL